MRLIYKLADKIKTCSNFKKKKNLIKSSDDTRSLKETIKTAIFSLESGKYAGSHSFAVEFYCYCCHDHLVA